MDNGLTDEVATNVVEMLKVNTTLTSLFLGFNDFTEGSMHAIIDTLENNFTLSMLVLDDFIISSEKMKTMNLNLSRNKHLSEFRQTSLFGLMLPSLLHYQEPLANDNNSRPKRQRWY
jgi:hypothetical protein